MKRYALIDADSDIFALAASSEISTGDGEYLQKTTLSEAVQSLRATFEHYEEVTEADDIIIALSDPDKNWRTKIDPTYKQNRKATRSPALRRQLHAKILEPDVLPFPVMKVSWLEADDVVGIAATTMNARGFDTVIVSQDKDLRTIPGKLWSPRPSSAGKDREIETITPPEADRNHLLQTLAGDTTDGYKGCPGIGMVKAITIVDSADDLAERWEHVVEAFMLKGLTREDALTQARLARILRNTEWDAKTKKVKLWKPPERASAIIGSETFGKMVVSQ